MKPNRLNVLHLNINNKKSRYFLMIINTPTPLVKEVYITEIQTLGRT